MSEYLRRRRAHYLTSSPAPISGCAVRKPALEVNLLPFNSHQVGPASGGVRAGGLPQLPLARALWGIGGEAQAAGLLKTLPL